MTKRVFLGATIACLLPSVYGFILSQEAVSIEEESLHCLKLESEVLQ